MRSCVFDLPEAMWAHEAEAILHGPMTPEGKSRALWDLEAPLQELPFGGPHGTKS
ncbi:MAG: hypothetical protein NZ742_06235 [Acidobacteria bacterium]|nr:hypothetical protein [Acidobacteriota bacterium]MDW7984472.1 hypothetical protein [Acidobacteriota bacterium]